MRFADFTFFSIWFSVFVKNTCLMGYRSGFRWSFGLSYLDSVFSSIQAALCASTDLLSSRETSVFPLVNTVSDRLGFWELGCEHILVLTVLHAVFGSSRIFFAVLRLWMIFSTALRFLIDPLILPHSGVPNGFLLCKLKISLSKITDLPFRSVPCLKLE